MAPVIGERVTAVETQQAMHEQECSRRYGELTTSIKDVADSVTVMGAKVDTIIAAQNVAAGAAERPKWWVPIVTVVIGVLLTSIVGVFGWLIAQVFDGRNARDQKLDELLRRYPPTQTVTVNPAPPAPVADPLPIS